MRANRTVRGKCQGSELFKSPNYPALGCTSNQDARIFWENVRESLDANAKSKELKLIERFSNNVIILTLHPSMNDFMLDLIYGEEENGTLYEAIIIEAFGKGNLPSTSRLKNLIEKKTKQGRGALLRHLHLHRVTMPQGRGG